MIEKLNKFIEDHIVMDEIDGIERTLVEFNFNDWIRFKRKNFDKKEEIEIIETPPPGIEPGPKKGTKSTHESQLYDSGVKKKVNKEIIEFIKDNCLAEDDESLVALIKHRFRVDTTVNTIKYWMSRNRISRRRMKKEASEMSETFVGKKKKFYPGKRSPRTMFPEEMEGFVRNNLSLSNRDLAKKVNIQFDLDMDLKKICDYMRVRNIKREKKIDKPKEKKKGWAAYWDKKKVGKPKIYTEEVLQFLRDNVNNFKNKELCEELESRFNIKVSQSSLQNTMSREGIKRDYQPDAVEPEIEDFILKSKEKDAYILRDKIIEKFEKNIPIRKVINLMGKRTEDLPGESVEEEVQRVEQKRDELDEEIDDLDLDT